MDARSNSSDCFCRNFERSRKDPWMAANCLIQNGLLWNGKQHCMNKTLKTFVFDVQCQVFSGGPVGLD